MSASQAPPPPGIPEEVWCKNRLQQYTQRASIPLPVYETFKEGAQHAPHFRSRVWVDGTCFVSPNTFSNRKRAEQDAAKHALIGIREKVKSEGCSRILQDTVFCKTIMNEYALKMNMKAPTFVTNESRAVLPVFVSSLILNGVTYIGDAGKSKKEAEQFAARSAILSILDTESGSTMSEIVKSKFKFYDALKKVKESSAVHGGTMPAAVNSLEGGVAPLSSNKRKEVQVSGGTGTDPLTVIPQSSFAPCPVVQIPLSDSSSMQPCSAQAQCRPLHEFKKPKSQTPVAVLAPPIEFVPPASENPLICPAPGKKRNRKSKKGQKKAQHQSLLTDAVMPQTLFPACSVAQ